LWVAERVVPFLIDLAMEHKEKATQDDQSLTRPPLAQISPSSERPSGDLFFGILFGVG